MSLLRQWTSPPLLASIPHGSQKLEEASGVPLYLPYQSSSPAVTPFASCPQCFGLAIQLRLTQHLWVTLLYKLEIHHLGHPWFSSFGWLDQAVFAPSVTPQPGAELRRFSS
jgi:hypothetical protein